MALEPHPKTLVARIAGDPRAWYPADLPPPPLVEDATPIPCGAIVATACLDAIGLDQETARSVWSQPESWHWVLSAVEVLATPIPCRGHIALGWRLPAPVRAQLAETPTTPAWRTVA